MHCNVLSVEDLAYPIGSRSSPQSRQYQERLAVTSKQPGTKPLNLEAGLGWLMPTKLDLNSRMARGLSTSSLGAGQPWSKVPAPPLHLTAGEAPLFLGLQFL